MKQKETTRWQLKLTDLPHVTRLKPAAATGESSSVYLPFFQITFYEGKCFTGRKLEVRGDCDNFQDRGFMNR